MCPDNGLSSSSSPSSSRCTAMNILRALPVLLCLVINIPSGEVKVDGVILLHCRRKGYASDLECEIHGVTIKKPNKYEFKMACPHQSAYDKVKVLVFDKSRAQFLPKSLFNVLRHVQSASLSHLELENIHPSAFHYARDLLYLDLSHNQLHQITAKEFYGATALEVLDLSYNQLVFIDPEAFSGLENLKQLILVGNKIDNTEFPLFTTHLPRLEHLDLGRNNNIGQATANTRCSNQTLLSLNLTGNALELLPTCSGSMINELVLSDNQISEINVNQIMAIKNLRQLDVSQNAIRNLNLLRGTTTSGGADNNMQLLTLNLSRCLIDRISKSDFALLPHLQVLDLSYNQLTHIPNNGFVLLKQLRELYIDGNLLKQVDLEAIKASLPGLEVLSISDNYWSCEYLDHILEVFCYTNVKVVYARGRACVDKNGNDVIIPVDQERPQDDRRVAMSEQLWFYVLLLFGIILSASLGYTALKKYCLNQFKYY